MEALLSSQIEGTQATLEDVLDPMIDTNTNLNVADVVNYIKATEFAVERLKTLPLCNRLIREIHAVLMEGVRGQERSPGKFRISQNWIGGTGSTLKTARYIPLAPEDMIVCMSEVRNKGDYEQWVKFFLQACYESVADAADAISELARLHDKNMAVLQTEPYNQNLLALFSYLEKNPIVEIKKTSQALGIAYNTVTWKNIRTLNLITVLLTRHSILKTTTRKTRRL